MRNKTTKKIEHFQHLIAHIDKTYEKLRGYKYPFRGKDFKDLAGLARVYRPFLVMAAWDAYLRTSNDWAKNNGYNIATFVYLMPQLLDNKDLKKASNVYEDEILGSIGKRLVELFSPNGPKMQKAS